MKRFLAVILCAVLILATLTGCAEPTDSETPPTTEQTPAAETPADTEAELTESEEITEEEIIEEDISEEEITEEEMIEEGIIEEEQIAFDLDDIIGVWHIDEGDLAALNEKFPGVSEFGTGMEITSDGNISWYIGADGAVGTYTVTDFTLIADVADEIESNEMTVIMTYSDDGTIKMVFRDTELTWTFGDGGSLIDEDEDI